MIDATVWLLRWTLAGAALSAIVIAAAYVLERQGRAVSLALFRATLLAALAAPMIALIPPVFTFSAPGITYAEPDRLVPRFIEKRAALPAGGAAADAQEPEASAIAAGSSADALAAALVALWIAGAASAAVSRQRSYARLSRAFRGGAPFPASFVECRLSAEIAGPLLFGVLRPRMLAPSDFREWADHERDAVLRHEAAHARRGDLLWAFIGDVARIAYWWAPPVRFLVSQHMLATEEACDSHSFARSDDRHDYARALLAVARRVGGHRSPGLAMTASSLRRRIDRLIASKPDKSAAPALPALALGVAAAFMLALSAPAAAGLNKFRIYIFTGAGETSSIYALSDGERATAASVEKCVGRLVPNAAALVDEIEGRLRNGRDDNLNTVRISGPGSGIEIGSCREKEPHDEDSDEESDENSDDHSDEDRLVLVTDASEKQARKLIRQIDALSRAQQQQMAAELGLK